jgi:hypothetical protein
MMLSSKIKPIKQNVILLNVVMPTVTASFLFRVQVQPQAYFYLEKSNFY